MKWSVLCRAPNTVAQESATLEELFYHGGHAPLELGCATSSSKGVVGSWCTWAQPNSHLLVVGVRSFFTKEESDALALGTCAQFASNIVVTHARLICCCVIRVLRHQVSQGVCRAALLAVPHRLASNLPVVGALRPRYHRFLFSMMICDAFFCAVPEHFAW